MSQALYLHVGHGKTGSSYLQTTLAGNRCLLEEHEYSYPTSRQTRRATSGRVSSGNWGLLKRILNGKPEAWPSNPRVLFSGEGLSRYLTKRRGQEQLCRLMDEYHVYSLHVLLFIRDPVAHAASAYQQRVKRSGYTGSIEDFFDQYEKPVQVLRLLDFLESISAHVTVRNYSATPSIITTLEEWLQLTPDRLRPSSAQYLNRSLTRAELEFQRRLNEVDGTRRARVLSNRLCHQLPDIKGATIRPALQCQHELWARLEESVTAINRRIGPHHRYDRARDLYELPFDEDLTLSERQIELITDVLLDLGARSPSSGVNHL